MIWSLLQTLQLSPFRIPITFLRSYSIGHSRKIGNFVMCERHMDFQPRQDRYNSKNGDIESFAWSYWDNCCCKPVLHEHGFEGLSTHSFHVSEWSVEREAPGVTLVTLVLWKQNNQKATQLLWLVELQLNRYKLEFLMGDFFYYWGKNQYIIYLCDSFSEMFKLRKSD